MRWAIFGLATCGALAAGFKQDPAEITSKRTAGGIRGARSRAHPRRVMPVASSGASSPLSAASTESFRTAVIRTLI